MAQATPAEVYEVVVDFPAYPGLFPELTGVRVVSTDEVTEATEATYVHRVEFRAKMVLPVRYVLDLTCVANVDAPTVDWRFVEGEVVTDSTGSWRFTPESGGTRVDYRAALDVRAPLPAFVLRKIIDGLVSASLSGMFTSIEGEVRRRRERRARG
jgi:ribosome-associated toxin RatA of RatAB toxin-antitoxin module